MPDPEDRFTTEQDDGVWYVVDTVTGKRVEKVVGNETVPVEEEPEPEPQPEPRDTGGPTLGRDFAGYADEFLMSVGTGVYNAVSSTGRFIRDPMEELGLSGTRTVYTPDGPRVMSIPEATEYDRRARYEYENRLNIYEPQTAAGKLVESLTRFGVGFIGAGKVLGPLKLLKQGGALRRLGYEAIRSGIADTIVSSPYEGRLSDALVELDVPVVSFLAHGLKTDMDDSVFVDRLKTVVEGAGLGLLIDTVMESAGGLYRGLKKSRELAAEGKIKEAQEAVGEAVQDYRTAMDGNEMVIHDALEDVEPEWVEAAMIGRAADDPIAMVFREGDEAADAVRAVDDGMLPERQVSPGVVARVGAGQRLGPLPDDAGEGAIKILNMVRAGMDGDDVAKNTVRAITEDVQGIKADFGLQGKITLRDVEEQASSVIGEDTARGLIAKLKENRLSLEEIETATAFLGNLVRTQMDKVKSLRRDLAPKVAAQSITDAERAAFAVETGRLEELMGLLSGVRTGASRIMNASRIQAKIHQDPGLIKSLFKNGDEMTDADVIVGIGGRDEIDDIIARELADDTGDAMVSSIRTKQADFIDKVINYRLNNMLSGPRTHLTNILSNMVHMVWIPTQRIVGGLAKGDLRTARQGFSQVIGSFLAIQDSLRLAGDAFANNRSVLDPGNFKLEGTLADYSFSDRTLWRKIGATLNLPSRGLLAGDELFMQMTFRARMYAELQEQAAEIAAKDGVAASKRWLWNNIEDAANDPARFIEGTLAGEALSEARLATFKGGAGKKLSTAMMKLAEVHPIAKVLMHMTATFVTTPSNIIIRAYEHMPLVPLIHGHMRKTLTGVRGPAEQARLIGAQVLGSGMATTVAGLYAAGRITAAAPEDAEERAAWFAAGKQPYSVKIGNTWFSYQRLEPIGMMVGLFAGAAEAADERSASVAWRAFTQNMTDKSFFKGASDFILAVNESERFFASYAEQNMSTFIPFAMAERQVSQAMNNRLYQNVQFGDMMRQMSFGIFNPEVVKIDLKGNPIEPGIDNALLPIYGTTELEDPVAVEMAEAAPGVNIRMRKKLRGVDLTPKQMHRLQILERKLRNNGGRTLYDELARLFESPKYQQTQPVSSFGEGFEQESPRAQMIQERIDYFRRMAEAKLVEEFPEILEKYNAIRHARHEAGSNNPEAVQQILEAAGVQ